MKSNGGFSEWNLKGLVGLFTESESSRKYNILCTRATFCLAVPNSKTKIVIQFCVKLVQFHCSDVSKNNWGQSCEKSGLIAERNQSDGPTRRNWPIFFYVQQKWNAIFTVLEIKYLKKPGHLLSCSGHCGYRSKKCFHQRWECQVNILSNTTSRP